MKILHTDELPIISRTPRGREGAMTRTKLIMTGDASRADNFSFRMLWTQADLYSPRHHHNFAQFSYVMEGESDFGVAGKVRAGTLMYMPEGVWYGPQTGPAQAIIALQHGGPSGWGMIGSDQHTQALEELKTTGTFAKGLYRPNSGGRAQDSYEAIWEHIRQRRIVYPKPQYSNPIFMDTHNFPWVPARDAPGVEEKAYGTFTAAKYGAASYRLEPGASFAVKERGMFIFFHGTGSIDQNVYRAMTTLYLEDG